MKYKIGDWVVIDFHRSPVEWYVTPAKKLNRKGKITTIKAYSPYRSSNNRRFPYCLESELSGFSYSAHELRYATKEEIICAKLGL